MAEYQLIYFNMRGRAEAIRMLFTIANVPFDDVRIPHSDFPTLKPTLPYGQIPILKYKTLVISQHITIGRFLSRKFGYYGKDEVEGAQIDELVDSADDHSNTYWACFGSSLNTEAKEIAMKRFNEISCPKYFSKWDKTIKENGGKFLVGDSVTWADVYIFNHIKFFVELTQRNLIQEYPSLTSFVSTVEALPGIQEWIKKRPDASVQKEEDEYDAIYN